MRSISSILGMFLLATVASGCGGSKLLKTKGRVLKDGAPFTVPQEDIFRIAFAPLEGARDGYSVVFNREDGTFWVGGKNLKGMPPGKYRVFFEYKPGEGNKSPLRKNLDDDDYIYDVDADTKEIVIDLDRAPGAPGKAKGSS